MRDGTSATGHKDSRDRGSGDTTTGQQRNHSVERAQKDSRWRYASAEQAARGVHLTRVGRRAVRAT